MTRREITAFTSLGELDEPVEVDVVVLGAGAAGLSAALFASLRGLDVLVVESSDSVGGTSALTAGTLWLPGRYPTDGRSAADDATLAGEYLAASAGVALPGDELQQTFVREGARAVRTLEQKSRVRFVRRTSHPDYLGDVHGASVAGRAIEAADFDGRLLGRDLRHVRLPLPDFTIFGGLAPNREELARYTVIATKPLSPRAWREAVRAAPRVARHAVDLVRYGRTSRLTLGNALIGALLASIRDDGRTKIVLRTRAVALHRDAQGIHGIDLEDIEGRRTVRVRGGVVSATGGFNRGPRRSELLPGIPAEWSAVVESATGSAHTLLLSVGAVFCRQGSDAFLAPVSLVPARGGARRIYPHFALDRGKPGFLILDRTGRRFLNESESYHRVGEGLRAEGSRAMPAYLIADRQAVKRYGIGVVKPGAWGLRKRSRDGYVISATDLDELARKLDFDPATLGAQVRRFNSDAERGVDTEFARGSTAYQKNLGDPHASTGPNPSLGAISEAGPFYAIRLHPGDIGAASGFAADQHGRALDRNGEMIPGLYVLGSDMRSIMGGGYPGPGITLGPAVVFAHQAVEDIAERASAASKNPKER